MNNNKKTKYIATSSLLAALSIVLMYIGSVVEVLDLSAAAVASVIITFAVIEIKGIYPLLIYAVVSAVSLLILPSKFIGIVYLVFAGFYPILKAVFEKKFGYRLSFIPKFILFNISLTLIVLAWVFVFLQPEEFFWMYIVVYIMGNAAFLLYDIALTRMITFYIFRLRKSLRIDKFFK